MWWLLGLIASAIVSAFGLKNWRERRAAADLREAEIETENLKAATEMLDAYVKIQQSHYPGIGRDRLRDGNF